MTPKVPLIIIYVNARQTDKALQACRRSARALIAESTSDYWEHDGKGTFSGLFSKVLFKSGGISPLAFAVPEICAAARC